MSIVEESDTDGHDRFSSLRLGGLDWDRFPLRLFMVGNARFWDPQAIDYSADAADWADAERRAATHLIARSCADEEAAIGTVRPFHATMTAEGRFGDEMYLSQLSFEKAKHTEGLRLWMDSVGLTEDLNPLVTTNPHQRRLVGEELPTTLDAMLADRSPETQIRALVTTFLVVQGALAVTGHLSRQYMCMTFGIMPGMRSLSRFIADDERRHQAWAAFSCRRLLAADPALWSVIGDEMNSRMPTALDLVGWTCAQAEMAALHFDAAAAVRYTADCAQRRLEVIGAARDDRPDHIEYDPSPLMVEDSIGEDDNTFFDG
ncbi:R2-like ligand-binding oxidase [Gordonia sp. ABSL1-1]|uniref:R2-like ligand-binding oxidase n=1 Tax=Gordonia sp. ABSL1-1 TaxID=3053923 RepID=UPI002573B439|nr:R2-like ligand-binding oxidase [Gordonia sp. ABSL1-1]MDL9935169.1 R2-like ligand-binding oxidase [Gordonia sp. ABSL1-1]